ncbi:MFS transporter [Actinomadura rubrisoli]|uniref:MFS transporter n=1 Tax=Actinomadura rubrisoli TaxID=2530368 RepID=A0A4R5C843_9ACTN|nr:MFS transporter [Actinomadura rubrisoli]TDD95305.1 MFS transporter [Actinomadura rubrisoli]
MTPTGHPSIRETLRRISWSTWLVLAGMLVNRLGSFLQVYLVLYLTAKGFSATAAGIALGAYGAGSVAGVLLGGAASDRFGHAWTIVGSMALAGVLTLGLVHLGSLPAIVLVTAVIGMAAQAYRPASSALLVRRTPEEQHVMVFAVYRMAFNLGTVGGPLLGALLITFSYELMFYADAVTSVGFALLALVLVRSGDRAEDGADDGEDDGAGAGDSDGAGPRRSYRAVLADRRFMLFMLALFLNAVVYIQSTAALPLQVAADGHAPAFYAALLSLNAFLVICLELPFTKYVQRLPAGIAVATGIGLVGVGMNLYAAGAWAAVFVAATVVWTVGEMVGTPTASAHPGRVAPPRLRGRYIAAGVFSMQIGYAVGPVIGVAVWQAWAPGAWWLCGLLTVVAVAATLPGMAGNRTNARTTDQDASGTRPDHQEGSGPWPTQQESSSSSTK